MYFCLLFLSVYAVQLVAGDPYDTGPSIKKLLSVKLVAKKSPEELPPREPLPEKPKEPEEVCIVKGALLKHGQFMVVKSTCTKYSCDVRKGSSVKILEQELLKDCFGLKCLKKGDVSEKMLDDKIFTTKCNDQLQVIVTRADCVFGGSIVENGESFQDYTKCIKYTCKVNNVGQEIRQVKIMEKREPIKDCSQ